MDVDYINQGRTRHRSFHIVKIMDNNTILFPCFLVHNMGAMHLISFFFFCFFFQVKVALNWLHGERIEYRRFAAVLILKVSMKLFCAELLALSLIKTFG